MFDQPMFRRVFVTTCVAAAASIAIGCDEQDQRNAAQKAGEGMEKTVNVVGEATRDAANAAGNVMERAGDKLQDATRDPATRPTTAPTLP